LPLLHRWRASRLPADVRRNIKDDEHLGMLLAWTLRADSTCVDVGASRGLMLAEFARLAPRGRHVAFEPIPEAHAGLVERFPAVDVRCAALSDEPGTATFNHVRSRPAYSGLKTRDYPGDEKIEVITVRVERLDDALPADLVPALLKIDVEGGELGVLRGGIETLRRHRPVVVFEHGRGAREHYGTTSDDVYDLLVEDVGLRIFDMDGNGPYDRDRFAAESDGSRWNWVAVPASESTGYAARSAECTSGANAST
jgi:FkbM family methyltransferase